MLVSSYKWFALQESKATQKAAGIYKIYIYFSPYIFLFQGSSVDCDSAGSYWHRLFSFWHLSDQVATSKSNPFPCIFGPWPFWVCWFLLFCVRRYQGFEGFCDFVLGFWVLGRGFISSCPLWDGITQILTWSERQEFLVLQGLLKEKPNVNG